MAHGLREAPQDHPVGDDMILYVHIRREMGAYHVVEGYHTEQNPEVNQHANKDMRLELLDADQVMEELENGCQLEPHEDAADARLDLFAVLVELEESIIEIASV
jgi:hypothetical protein